MVWRRLPTLFPNIRLHMLPLSAEQLAQVKETGWLREVAFRTEPKVNKAEIRAFMESVHGMQVDRVHTINYEGKKKRYVDRKGRQYWYRRNDWKKVYVLFKPPDEVAQRWQEAAGARYSEQLQLHERQRQQLQDRRQQHLQAAARLRGWRQRQQQQQQQQGAPGPAAGGGGGGGGSSGSSSGNSSGNSSSRPAPSPAPSGAAGS